MRDCDLVKFANLTPTPEQCATSITTGEAIVRATMPHSMGTTFDDETDTMTADPVAAAQLRAPFAADPEPEPPKRVRSPYEPPDEPPTDAGGA